MREGPERSMRHHQVAEHLGGASGVQHVGAVCPGDNRVHERSDARSGKGWTSTSSSANSSRPSFSLSVATNASLASPAAWLSSSITESRDALCEDDIEKVLF